MKKENDQLKKNNNILAKNILKLQKKIEKYENHPNINLEIKEIVGSDEEKLTVAEINWAKLVNSKIEDEESSLEEELAMEFHLLLWWGSLLMPLVFFEAN